jgi:hypothetical protein
MSGQPLIHPTDASKFREQYLATLSQQIKVDDKNLQANKIHKKTGQTPSLVLDLRTGQEKLADIYRLKMELRSGLKDIMEGANAERFVNETDDPTIQFVAQRLPEIISILKPKYKYGVPYVSFTTFIRQYMNAVMESGDYIAGFQQNTGKQLLMGVRQILGQMLNQDSLDEVKRFISGRVGAGNEQLIGLIRRDLADLEMVIPSKQELEYMMTATNAIQTSDIQKQLSDALEELPTRQQIELLMAQIFKNQQMGDMRRQAELLDKLHQLLAVPEETREQMALIRQEIGQTKGEILGKIDRQTGTLTADNARRRAEEARLRQDSERLTAEQKMRLESRYRSLTGLQMREEKEEYIDEMLESSLIKGEQGKVAFLKMWGNANSARQLSDAGIKAVIDEINKRISILTSGKIRLPQPPPPPPPTQAQAQDNPIPARRGRPPRNPLEPAGRGIRGRGISHLTDYSQGVMTTPPRYVPFGRFHINTHKLGEDIINMRRPTGCNVYGFPVRRVSADLGSVLRTIVGGGQPEYRQLEKLSDEEKVYLSNLVKKAQIGDRLSVPTPNKDDDEKDVHQYEVMKGEILSGNDNVDMVKKFKILIMKMMRKELLPKSQAKEILLDLATLGY